MHVSDESLNEYLDDQLKPPVRAQVDAHLAVCDSCTARLTKLQVFFARLDAASDVALVRDLSAGVRQALERSVRPQRRVQPRSAAAWPRLIVAVQAMAALALLAVAWPQLSARLEILAGPGLGLATNMLIVGAMTGARALADWTASLIHGSPLLPIDVIRLPWDSMTLTPVAACAAILWAASHLLLLRLPLTDKLRRQL